MDTSKHISFEKYLRAQFPDIGKVSEQVLCDEVAPRTDARLVSSVRFAGTRHCETSTPKLTNGHWQQFMQIRRQQMVSRNCVQT